MSEDRRNSDLMLIIALLGTAVCTAFEAYGTITAMPVAAEELGHVDWYAWAFTTFLISQVIALVMSGRLVDKYGPAMPMILGSGLFLLGLLAAGLAPTMAVLLIARFIQGLGAGTTGVAFMVVIAQAFEGHRRARLMSIMSFCWMLPSFVGPLIAAWLTETFSWHWVFLALVPVMLVITAVGLKPLLELRKRWTPNQSTAPVPVWAAVVAAIGLAAIQYAAQHLEFSAIPLVAVGIIAVVIALPKLMPAGFARLAKGLPATMWTRGMAAGAFFSTETFFPLLLRSQYSFSLSQAGLFLAVGAVSWSVGSWVQASRSLKLRRDTIIVVGVAALAAGLILNAVTVFLTLPWELIGIGYFLGGFGMGFAVTGTSLVNMELSAPNRIGRNTSSLQVSEGLGNSLATGLVGAVFAGLHAVASTQLTFGLIQLVALAAAGLAVVAALRIGHVRNDSSGIG